MIKKRLKVEYLLLFLGILMILPLLITFTFVKTNLNDVLQEETDYITEDVIENSLPVVNTKTRIISPFMNDKVHIVKSYYDYKAEESSQINSITYHDNTYSQNTGIDYAGDNNFEVVAILDGTVIEVKEDKTLGKVIEISHNNDLVSIYQSLKEVNVKKGELVSQGQIIGMSGENELDSELGNHLHFEIYDKGQPVNPENYLNKEISQEKGN